MDHMDCTHHMADNTLAYNLVVDSMELGNTVDNRLYSQLPWREDMVDLIVYQRSYLQIGTQTSMDNSLVLVSWDSKVFPGILFWGSHIVNHYVSHIHNRPSEYHRGFLCFYIVEPVDFIYQIKVYRQRKFYTSD